MKIKVDVEYISVEGRDGWIPHPKMKAEIDLTVEILAFIKKSSPETFETLLNTLRKTMAEITRGVQVS